MLYQKKQTKWKKQNLTGIRNKDKEKHNKCKQIPQSRNGRKTTKRPAATNTPRTLRYEISLRNVRDVDINDSSLIIDAL